MSTAAITTNQKLPACKKSAVAASSTAFGALLLRDLTVLRKSLGVFIARTIVQPFLLVFVFLYVFPKIGEGVGGGTSGGLSAFATVLVAGVVGLSTMFQGIQAVALPLATEFGFTKEIEDRVLAPLPISMVAMGKVLSGAIQGIIAAVIVFPIAAVIHAPGIHPTLTVTWWKLLTMLPLTAIMTSGLGLWLGTAFEPRNISFMFGFIILPLTFLGGTYYPWTQLAAIKVGGFPWLQALVCINPLIYVTEGFRASLTTLNHMHLYVVYPVLIGFCVFFLWIGTRNFYKRVLS